MYEKIELNEQKKCNFSFVHKTLSLLQARILLKWGRLKRGNIKA